MDEIKNSLTRYHKVAIVGCGGCAAVCQAGGTKQVEELADKLDEKEVVFTFQIDEPCDQRVLTRELRRISEKLEQVDAVLVLACGTGVQTMAASIDTPCVAGLNTLFAGTVIHSRSYFEHCVGCGDCILNHTAAICPRTRCPKAILNGPCSEKVGEHCDLNPDQECVWVTITNRREARGLSEPDVEFSPIDWSKQALPRKLQR
ncbi:MAG: methylenetetrahydrofolate reductase C-terminal domain-containing protein [Candidatus Abyssubacteria bacterium]